MAERTGIQWTRSTFNPWWGCAHVSPGCANCYAESLAGRFTKPGQEIPWGKSGPRRLFSDAHWREPVRWNKAAGRELRDNPTAEWFVFCASMADVFEPHPAVADSRQRLFDLVEATGNLTWLLLTKRPELVADLVPRAWLEPYGWPRNAWLGTSVEDQRRAEERIPELLEIPAPHRFLSCEPLLEAVDLSRWYVECEHVSYSGTNIGTWRCDGCGQEHLAVPDPNGPVRGSNGRWRYQVTRAGGPSWVIIGGESGPGARPFNLAWARRIVEDVRAGGAAPYVKQLGRVVHEDRAGQRHRILLNDDHGGDWDEWPDDLRVRERPPATRIPIELFS